MRGLEGGFKGASRGLEGGFKGASRGLEGGLKPSEGEGGFEGLERGLKGASRGLERGKVSPCSKCLDCFGTYFTHVQTCNVTRVQVLRNVYCGTFLTHEARVPTAWTASVHTLHMSKPVM